jgi:1-deoxy-D-xylulose-5-phosphate reductoisomerase
VVVNAANELAVAAFLDRRLRFVEIPRIIERALDTLGSGSLASIEQCVAVDSDARRRVREWLDARAGGSAS